MSDTLTSDPPRRPPAAPDYPMERPARCPFAPPRQVMELAASRTAEPGPDLGRQHPVADHRLRGGAGAVRRLPGQRRRPHARVPALERSHARHGGQAARARCSPPTPRSTRSTGGCCPSRSPSSGWRACARPSRRSPTTTSTRSSPDPQPAELVSALALPVPSLVISEMLGVPYEDHGFFQEHANVGLARYATAEDSMKGVMSLGKYLSEPRRSRRWRTRPRTRCPIWPSGSRPVRSASRRPRSWPAAC